MNNVIIFDFNRTLFEPDSGQLAADAEEVLQDARDKGYTLVLLAKAKPSRDKVLASLGIGDYFAETHLVEAKRLHMLRGIAERHNADLAQSFVVGDRALGEVQLGYKAGWRTIWLQAGKFASELPSGYAPDHTITTLSQVTSII
jgi:FMN phosphatase YigB (HAD superfamily)